MRKVTEKVQPKNEKKQLTLDSFLTNEIPLDADQQRAVNAKEKVVLIDANAGSGKTHALTQKYINLLKKERDFSRIVAITFTEKAAEELKSRILEAIDKLRLGKELKIDPLGITDAPIGTIHHFCNKIITEYGIDYGIFGGYKILNEIQAEMLLESITKKTLISILSDSNKKNDEKSKLEELLNYERNDLSKVIRNIVELISTLRMHGIPLSEDIIELENYSNGNLIYDIALEMFNNFTKIGENEKKMAIYAFINTVIDKKRRNYFSKFIEIIEGWVDESIKELNKLATSLKEQPQSKQKEKITRALKNTKWVLEYIRKTINSLKDTSEDSQNIDLIIAFKSIGKELKRIGRSRVKEIKYKIKLVNDFFDRFYKCVRMFTDINHVKTLLNKEIEVIKKYIYFAKKVREAFDQRKRELNFLDFDDLLEIVDTLLDDDEIAKEIGERYRYILIDEFQDVNQLQFSIFKKIYEKSNKTNLYFVGDPKQSIYRFRGANVAIFNSVRDRKSFKNVGIYTLPTNYRSLNELINHYNALFERIFDRKYESALFESKYLTMKRKNNKKTNSRKVEFLFAIGKGTMQDIRRQEAELIAKRIIKLIREEGYRPGDIVLLMRSFSQAPLYEATLNKYGIKFKVLTGSGFFASQEIKDVLMLLKYLICPSDKIALIGLLRSPFVGMSDTELYKWRVLGERSLKERVQEFTQKISRYRQLLEREKLSVLMEQMLNEFGYKNALLMTPGGESKVANIEKLRAMITDMEKIADANSYSIIKHLLEMHEREAKEPPAKIEIEDKSSVKLMTIHAAKGLEFPVVFIVGGASTERPSYSSFVFDENIGLLKAVDEFDERGQRIKSPRFQMIKFLSQMKNSAEVKRLLYVAATRAIDKLIYTFPLEEINIESNKVEEEPKENKSTKNLSQNKLVILRGHLKLPKLIIESLRKDDGVSIISNENLKEDLDILKALAKSVNASVVLEDDLKDVEKITEEEITPIDKKKLEKIIAELKDKNNNQIK